MLIKLIPCKYYFLTNYSAIDISSEGLFEFSLEAVTSVLQNLFHVDDSPQRTNYIFNRSVELMRSV